MYRFTDSVTLYALVAVRTGVPVDLFPSKQEADEAMDRIVLTDPHLTGRLRVILVAGGANLLRSDAKPD